MPSPMGELPVRRHLLPEVAMLVMQTARGARLRALRRQAVLGGRAADTESFVAGAEPGPAVWEAAAPAVLTSPPGTVSHDMLTSERVAVPDGVLAAAPPRVTPVVTETAALATPVTTASSLVRAPVMVAGGGGGPAADPVGSVRPVAALPPVVRLMAAATRRAARAEALRREPAAWAPPAAARPGWADLGSLSPGSPASVSPAATAPGSGRAPAASPFGPHPAASFGPGLVAPAAGALPAPGIAPGGYRQTPVPAAAPDGFLPAAGPAPAPVPGSPGSPGSPGALPSLAPAPAPAGAARPDYPESELLAEERLREQLARILRADGLRHGLDLKER